jgi:hypothetical protein
MASAHLLLRLKDRGEYNHAGGGKVQHSADKQIMQRGAAGRLTPEIGSLAGQYAFFPYARSRFSIVEWLAHSIRCDMRRYTAFSSASATKQACIRLIWRSD